MVFTTISGRFAPGRLVATPAALNAVLRSEMMDALWRHLHCDWGDVSAEDARRNDQALHHRERLFSAYHTRDNVKFWIITEEDRSATTILLPEDY